ncbi:multiubiquitin domain-containing protein [Aquamicrobium zhengzhouense]|uniref:Multiubiquitin domain-containing protein n=1 Tax=Aquamicrobium zhengzhouense TaxID=2781738 RepID=A0ABS0SB16_9HYPH|nr:multiubiquitin domain-containing protein [Aquamicrobium zhengzhouense]MBI1620489.1 multiubiquitin domain-containing protein [Aquamicrobium zhengzhouense]
MTTEELLDYDDLGDALREGRALRPAREYRFLLAQGDLNFKSRVVSDPVPLGRQLLEAAALDPRDGYSLFAILPSGDFEDVRLNEPFDLRERGAERFIVFQTDRDFKLTLNDDELRWGKPAISGTILYGLAKPGEGEGVFLEVPGGEDRLVEHGDLIDLTEPGIERFITARLTFEIVVNSRPRTVNARTVTFEQIVQLAFPGQHELNVVFSMTYRHAASTPHAGELGAGGSVDVKKKGTVFNVTRTVQS